MRFVEIKTENQQALLAIHRTRDLVVRQRTQVANMIRGLLREFGHVLPTGVEEITSFSQRHLEGDCPDIPDLANGSLGTLCDQLLGLNARIDSFTKLIERHARRDIDARRPMQVPGVSPITASAIVATVGDARQFKTGRDLAAWLGLTPLNKSSGGKERLGRITKKGDHSIRRLLIVGMTSRALMANTSARTIWALLTRQEDDRQPVV